MAVARLGNIAAIDRGQLLPGNRVTTFQFLGEDTLDEQVRTVVHEDGLWPRLSLAPPAWVECDDPTLEFALAEHFNCPTGCPDDWD